MSKSPEAGYQPTKEEIQSGEEKMSEWQAKSSAERERVDNEGAKDSLLRYAEELDYDDMCGGDAVEAFRKELVEISKHVEELENAGYTVRASCSPKHMGGASVYLDRGGESIEIYSRFYDTYSKGFYISDSESESYAIREKIKMALKMSKMFGGEATEG